MNNVAVIAIGIYMFIVGICSVTNITIDNAKTITGWAALVAGIICLAIGTITVLKKNAVV